MPSTDPAGPDPVAALEKYRRRAPGYDRRTWIFRGWRSSAVDRLRLQAGDVVIDVACGTGVNFALIEERIGAGGRLIGIDQSPDMLAQARRRISAAGWANVTLLEARVEEAKFDEPADAALFSFTHDVLQSAPAVANVVANLRPGARVASMGSKLAPRWNLPANLVVRGVARRYTTTLRNLDRPWQGLERYAELRVQSLALGGAYVAWGRLIGPGPGAS
jgi:SAM-dependent methyltransferase